MLPLWDGTAITYLFNAGRYINSNWLLRYAAGDLGTMAMCAVQPPSKQIMEEQKEARWKGTAGNMLDMGRFWRQPRKVPQGPEFLGLQNQWSPTLSIFQRSILVLLDSYEGFAQCSAKCWCQWIHSHIIVDSCRVSHSHIFSYISQFPNIS